MSEPDFDYYEAKRQARALLGQHADVNKDKTMLHPARVGVWLQGIFVLVGAGQSYREALDDARSRQKMLEQKV